MLKLGTQTGSLVNHIQSRAVIGAPEPTIGMGATLLGWTDRHPATVVAIEGDIVTVQEDDYKRIDKNGLSESQEYEFKPNLNGAKRSFRKMPNGRWMGVWKNPKTGRWNKNEGEGVLIGRREKYHDFSF